MNMTSRERIHTIFAGQAADRCGFWMGNPHPDSWPLYFDYFHVTDERSVRRLLGDDFLWVWGGAYRHPQGKSEFDFRRQTRGLSAAGCFTECETVDEVDAFDWPNPAYLDFSGTLDSLRQAGDLYRASGMWSPFFHIVADAFGMENYFIKMYTHPEVVEAVTRHICEYYLAANEILFAQAGELIDGFFFGNDFGSQLDLLISPDLFDRFIMPWFRRFTEQGHAHGYQVILHSCGSIHKVLERLIAAGVDALHPLQALAVGMDATNLAQHVKGHIAFLGGIDTQQLLVHGTPEEVRADVRRVKALLGPSLVVSPSHEALLPNVPPENVLAMSEAARE